jgi:hypothetical protein
MLSNLLLMSYGPRFVIAEEFAGVKGVDRLFIFGSWAARYQGIEGYPPQDIDVLVIGDVNYSEVMNASIAAAKRLQIDVNPSIHSHTWWKNNSGSGFRQEIGRRPIVEIEVRDVKQPKRKNQGATRRRKT